VGARDAYLFGISTARGGRSSERSDAPRTSHPAATPIRRPPDPRRSTKGGGPARCYMRAGPPCVRLPRRRARPSTRRAGAAWTRSDPPR
jgi:hypothetical protein